MESLLSLVVHRERRWLRLVTVDADASHPLADAFGIATIPTLVLLREGEPVERIEGRASSPKIEAMLRRHLPDPRDSEIA